MLSIFADNAIHPGHVAGHPAVDPGSPWGTPVSPGYNANHLEKGIIVTLHH